MTEGLRTVVAQPRLEVLDLLELYENLTTALQRVAAVTRMHQTECHRLYGKAGSTHDVLMAWQNSTQVLEAACLTLQQAHDAIMDQAMPVCSALRAMEAND